MRRKNTWLIHVLLIITCLIVSAPILFALAKATQGPAQVLSASLMPGDQLWNNVKSVWQGAELGTFMRNTFIIAIAVTVGKTVLGLMAGMALVYFRIPFKSAIFGFILLTLMMPTEVLIIGLFDVISQAPPPSWAAFWEWISHPLDIFTKPIEYGFGWANTYWALIVPFLASATATFLFRQHFMSIPRELADAARIDGSGPLRFLTSILIPMSWNTIGALAVIEFVFIWNQYLWPLVIIRRTDRQMIQVGLNLIISTGEGVQWGYVMAGAIIALIPPLLVFMLLQEQFMRGFALSQEK